MAAPVLKLDDIQLSFGGVPLLESADLTLAPGDRLCLVGRNGSGKSTLLKIAAGLVEPDRGERFLHPGASLRYLAQEADFGGASTVREYVTAGLGPLDDAHAAEALLLELGLDPGADPALLSGGEARRAALANVLAPEPDVLLLDEPTNHLDLPTIEWLETRLADLKSALLIISHDRRFLETLSKATLWLDRGHTRLLGREFSQFEAWRDGILEEQDSARHKLDQRISREMDWMHGGVTARRKRNVRRVRELAAMRRQRRDERRATGNVRLEAASGALSGRLVIEADAISKRYDERPVIRDFSTRIMRGDRVGIVGPNGAGKTTLIKILTGAIAPDTGSVHIGANVQMLVVDQGRESLQPDLTVADALTGGRSDQVVINGQARHVTSYMRDFLFSPEQRNTAVSVLSGGERGRLMLARALSKPSNLLVLDEPTNDLDIETLDLLQELLADYGGTVLIVSHDRDFLDRVVTSVIAPETAGRWVEYAGGYSDMLAQRRGEDLAGGPARSVVAPKPPASRAQPKAAQPKRKLSFHEKHALDTLPATLEQLATEIIALEARLADATLYARDPKAFGEATSRLERARADHAAAEDRWLELEILREDLDR